MTDVTSETQVAPPLPELLDAHFEAEARLDARLTELGLLGAPVLDFRAAWWMLARRGQVLVHTPEPFTQQSITDGMVIFSAEIVPKDGVRRIDGLVFVQADARVDFVGAGTYVLDPAKECTDPALVALHAERWR